MKILIKGAGDRATGIASRLYGAGHQIMMTEIPVPLTVRRTVALSRAVYAGWTEVEEMKAFRADSREKAGVILSRGDIPVIVDPEAECRSWYEPDVVVDASWQRKTSAPGSRTLLLSSEWARDLPRGMTATVWWKQSVDTLLEISSGGGAPSPTPESRGMWEAIPLNG